MSTKYPKIIKILLVVFELWTFEILITLINYCIISDFVPRWRTLCKYFKTLDILYFVKFHHLIVYLKSWTPCSKHIQQIQKKKENKKVQLTALITSHSSTEFLTGVSIYRKMKIYILDRMNAGIYGIHSYRFSSHSNWNAGGRRNVLKLKTKCSPGAAQ